ncbi:MAG TPA: dihydrodipicolinate synthase family protein [Vicinamibacterales bacterium]|nr:dihydrodipicolinate synthase family protein [Vicinamibacterales bacterium]
MNLAGVFAPVPTPFDDRGGVSTDRLTRALARWTKAPIGGFVVLGSNGEAPFLDEEESDQVIGAARDAIPAATPMIAGTGRESTAATIRATGRAAALGATAVLVRTPGFFKSQMTSDLFVRHYTAVADTSPVPVLLYNFTGVTGVTIQADAVARLSAHPNIIGLKESNGDPDRIRELVAAVAAAETARGVRGGFAILAGSATTFHPSLVAGATGGVLVLSTILPHACAQLFALARAGKDSEARAIQERVAPLSQLIGSKYGVAGVKAALNLAGYDVGEPRLPLVPLPEAARAALKETLALFEEVAA